MKRNATNAMEQKKPGCLDGCIKFYETNLLYTWTRFAMMRSFVECVCVSCSTYYSKYVKLNANNATYLTTNNANNNCNYHPKMQCWMGWLVGWMFFGANVRNYNKLAWSAWMDGWVIWLHVYHDAILATVAA